MAEVAVAATTGDNTSLSVSLELGSAVAGMSGPGPEGSSSWWKKGEENQPLWAQCLLGPARGPLPPPQDHWVETSSSQPPPQGGTIKRGQGVNVDWAPDSCLHPQAGSWAVSQM